MISSKIYKVINISAKETEVYAVKSIKVLLNNNYGRVSRKLNPAKT